MQGGKAPKWPQFKTRQFIFLATLLSSVSRNYFYAQHSRLPWEPDCLDFWQHPANTAVELGLESKCSLWQAAIKRTLLLHKWSQCYRCTRCISVSLPTINHHNSKKFYFYIILPCNCVPKILQRLISVIFPISKLVVFMHLHCLCFTLHCKFFPDLVF